MENLIIFWGTVTEQKANGALNGWSKKDIELAAEWSGAENAFCDAMIESGFLDVTKNGFYPHDWAENQPWVVGSEDRIEAARKAGKASAAARRSGKRKNKLNGIATDGQRPVEKPLNGIATDGQRNCNPRTDRQPTSPSPSPSPLKTTLPSEEEIKRRVMKDDNGVLWDIDSGEQVEDCPFEIDGVN